jgi:MFS family permease
MKGNNSFPRDLQFYKFSAYGFLKNLRFFDPFIILFFLEMGINYIQIGILFSIREIAVNILELPTGIVADSYGRRRSMIFSFISYIISFAIFYFFPGFFQYAVAMIFFSFGEAFRTGTHKAMILTYLDIKGLRDYKVHYYGHTRSASQLGSAFSALIAMVLVFLKGSYRIVFLSSIIPYLLELILMLSYPKELDGKIEKGKASFLKNMIDAAIKTTKNFISIFKNGLIIKALFNSSVFSALYKSTKDYIQPMIKSYALTIPVLLAVSDKQRTTVVIGIVYFFIYLMTSYTSRKSGTFSNKVKHISSGINMTYFFGTTLLLLSGIFLYLKLYLISILFFIMMYLIENLRKPLNVGYISDLISLNVMATGLSGESQLKTIFTAVFSFLMGVVAQYAGVSVAIISVSLITILIFPFIKLSEIKV